MDKKSLEKVALTIRTLSMDAVQKANSGHPGLPMGCAEIGALLYGEVMNYNPAEPKWINRDRFILSAGHGSMLVYSLLHLAGFGLSLDEVKNFRQFGSKTPGHPEYGMTIGVEVTTGPLGQGISNAVGMASAERIMSAKFNTGKHKIIDHYIYVLAGEGDLMEGVTAEAVSFAGHHKLGKLIVLFDCNKITIEGSTDIAFTEDVLKRFEAYGWHTSMGDPYDFDNLSSLIEKAKNETEKPSIILLKTVIAKGSPNKAGTHGAHGAPLGEDEVKATKKALGVPEDAMFYVAPEAVTFFENKKKELAGIYDEWSKKFDQWKNENQALYEEWQIYMSEKEISTNSIDFPPYNIGDKVATRKAGGDALNAVAKALPNIVGGSADLAPSNNTYLKGMGDFTKDSPTGRNFHFGVREHGMGSIVNGLCLYGGLRAYCGTFLVFSDYMRPPIRLAALMKVPAIYVFTHDSIYVGEDGPTHQPVEHFAALRTIPGLRVLRPADAEETNMAWTIALESKNAPTAILLTRQNLTVFEKSDKKWKENIKKGAYVANESEGKPEMVIVATGSEVNLGLEVKEKLGNKKIRVVSVISRELFMAQSDEYKKSLIPDDVRKVIIEAGISFGWEGLAGEDGQIISIENFGESGPASQVAKHFGFDAEAIAKKIVK